MSTRVNFIFVLYTTAKISIRYFEDFCLPFTSTSKTREREIGRRIYSPLPRTDTSCAKSVPRCVGEMVNPFPHATEEQIGRPQAGCVTERESKLTAPKHFSSLVSRVRSSSYRGNSELNALHARRLFSKLFRFTREKANHPPPRRKQKSDGRWRACVCVCVCASCCIYFFLPVDILPLADTHGSCAVLLEYSRRENVVHFTTK